MMRTTLTLDDDVAARLQELRANGKSFKELVNDALRAGLDALGEDRRPTRRDYTTPMDLGKPFIDNLDDVQDVLDVVEGPRRR